MHYAIPPGSAEWWIGIAFSLAFIALPPYILRDTTDKTKLGTGKAIGAFILLVIIVQHFYLLNVGKWHLRTALPLHLCSISVILAGIIHFKPSQGLFELLVYWGLPGAFHSLITPELTHGFSTFLFAEYYIAHAGIFSMAVFATTVYGMKLRKNSWFKVWLFTQPVLAVVGIINYLTGGNYMYLSEKPIAENPFVIGDWPWYILGLQLAGLLHFAAVYGIFYLFKKV
ncbi:MAG: TIGR02206 family membrane protein [Bacteroidetes bacterium]|nr:TIGR02206 family membrane protein [Bacteroidota bacterium]